MYYICICRKSEGKSIAKTICRIKNLFVTVHVCMCVCVCVVCVSPSVHFLIKFVQE